MVMGYDFKEGEYTSRIYALIRDTKYKDAIDILNYQLQINTKSRAALSLLAYCYFQIQDYVNASDCYEQLTQTTAENEQYKLNYAHCLYKCGLYDQAMKVVSQIDDPKSQSQVLKLKATIKYAEDDVKACADYVNQLDKDDMAREFNKSCIFYKEGKYEAALEKFKRAQQIIGSKPEISYNIGVCYYQLRQYDQALRSIAEIIEKGIKEHPELSIGLQTDGIEVASVGNTLVLHESCLVEAFNLKAAIHFNMKKMTSAKEALTDMPPRSEAELDQITLHNIAIMNMEDEPSAGFEKLQYLIQQNSFPFETFANLCFLYVKYSFFSLVADVLAENSTLAFKHLTPYEYEFLEAKVIQQTSPEEAYRRFDVMATKHIEMLRKLHKDIQEARRKQKDEATHKFLIDYEEYFENYVPVLMAQSSIYWDLKNYAVIEKFLRKAAEFCSDSETWQLNLGHCLFMQDTNKYPEAIDLYKSIVRRHYDNILDVSPIVLANLCVTYVMCNLNEEAEDLMKKIEKEEDQMCMENPNAKIYHLCIVNIVIGTLYCAKNNYEFGISRVMKSLEPYKRKLSTDTWYYTKRCFLALFENMAKQLIIMKDAFLAEIFQFLNHCELYGRDIKANVELPMDQPIHPGMNTVAFEARYLKWLLFKLIDY